MMQQRGIALLVVLWVMALLSLLLGSLAGWVQLENRQALHLRQHSQALLAAEAGVELA
ncbi:PilX N-terminal domain-containing pilus assembly protein, partial [Pseudomonas savastanoi]